MANKPTPDEVAWEQVTGRSAPETLQRMVAAGVKILTTEHSRKESHLNSFLSDEAKMEYFGELVERCLDNYISNKSPLQILNPKPAERFRARNLLKKALSIIESIESHEILALNNAKREEDPYFYTNKVISPIEDAILFFHHRAKLPPGRRSHEDLEIPLDRLMDAFEYAVDRKFRRNYKIHVGTNDFVNSDAKFLVATLREMDRSITPEMVKTVLKNYKPRKPHGQKIRQ